MWAQQQQLKAEVTKADATLQAERTRHSTAIEDLQSRHVGQLARAATTIAQLKAQNKDMHAEIEALQDELQTLQLSSSRAVRQRVEVRPKGGCLWSGVQRAFGWLFRVSV
eukprot:m.241203 g.241203  ORF g.241203 m.241203 type:complete len:110 (-) comp18996_c0_seq1:99-428(-)